MKNNNILKVLIIVSILINFQNCKKTDISNPLDPEFSQYFSWQEQDIMTSAKEQGSYGSCGVFAAMGVVEALIKQKSGQDIDLSEQHYINGSGTWAETGVNPSIVFEFIRDNGIVIEARLPYVETQTNDLPDGDMDYYIDSFGHIALSDLSVDEARKKVKESLIQYGPVAVAIDGMNDLQYYNGGVYQPGSSATAQFGHWIVIVGWQDDDSVSTGGYWIIKNSWGTSWGNNGFGNIAYEAAGIDRYVLMYANYIQ